MEEGTRLAVVTDDPAEAHRSPVDLALLADPAGVCAELVHAVSERPGSPPTPFARPPAPEPPGPGERLLAGHVLAALAERLPADAVLVEEAPSARPELHARIPVRRPLGFLTAAMGGLGFGLSAPVGVRMALPDRPVVALVGDGSSLYTIQTLWSAASYDVGVLFVVLANGGYRIMDRLAEGQGEGAPWPDFGAVDIAAMARAQGCEAERVETHEQLIESLEAALAGLEARTQPLLLEVVVEPGMEFQP